MSNISIKNIAKTSFYVGTMLGFGYFAAIVFLHLIGMSMTGWIEWIFRIAIVACVTWSVIGFRMRYAPRGMAFGPAFGLGMFSSLILGIYMAISIFAFHTAIAPDYNEKFQTYYRAKRSDQMYNTQWKKLISENDENYKLTAADTAIVEKGLNLHIDKSQFYFSAVGAVTINFIFSLVWGLAVSLTIAFLARKK